MNTFKVKGDNQFFYINWHWQAAIEEQKKGS